MDKVIIARAIPEDAEKLTLISRQTFYETFSEQNTKENMQKYLDESFSIERLTDELRDAHSRFYFAKSGHDIVGYIKINLRPSSAEIKNIYSLEIERIYVRRDFQGKKVGLSLYEKAMHIARESKADHVWLGVWEKNDNAIAFYNKLGFVAFGSHPFRLGDDIQTDILMMKKL